MRKVMLYARLIVAALMMGVTIPSSAFAQLSEAVDRLLTAFNQGDLDEVEASFTPSAIGYYFVPENSSFSPIEWTDFPRGYFQGSGVSTIYRLDVDVLDRIISRPFVVQRERWNYQWAQEDTLQTSYTSMVTYQIQDSLVYRIWYYPTEPRPEWVPEVTTPTFEPGTGPQIFFDVGHFNRHQPDGSYWPLAEGLRRDGYSVHTWTGSFTPERLAAINMLVIANALEEERVSDWSLPAKSAFSQEEIDALKEWVGGGGSLLLITDHPPYAGAVIRLAEAFDVEVADAIVRDEPRQYPDVFRRSDGTLLAHEVTNGSGTRVDSVGTFGGTALRGHRLEPILALRPTMKLMKGDEAASSTGWSQAGTLSYGRGRVAIFGEAALFRILTPEADASLQGLQNAQLVRNLFRWLSGL